jgi:hypothetical protein
MKKFVLNEPGAAGAILALFLVLLLLTGVGVFAWWAFSWTTHTLVWFIFIFGSLLGSVRVRSSR